MPLTIGNAVAYSRWREILTMHLNWMPKREQIITLPTVADLPSDNPRPILVSRIYQRVCIFCEKDKYTRNSRTTEEKCVDMHADETIRKAAAGKCDNRILAVISRELVVAEALYHKSCYHNQCTRNIQSLGIRKKTASIPNISKPNCRDMTTLEPICYKILGV